MKRNYMKPSEVGSMVAQVDFRIMGRGYKAGDEFDPRKVYRSWRRDWRKVMNLYRRGKICTPDQWVELNRTEGDTALDEGWNPSDAQMITESDFADVVTDEEKEVLIHSREELEDKYRDLGGRVKPDWSDEKLLEMIEKKS